MFRLIPPSLHRLILPPAFALRHYWRKLRKIELFGVVAILRDQQDRVLFVRHNYGPQVWSIPGGGMKPQEAPEEAIAREVLEEVGCSILGLRLIDTIRSELSGSPHTMYLFTGTINELPRADKRELSDARLFPASSMPTPIGKQAQMCLDRWRESMRRAP
ncbi:NUDIX hydrolase [Altererythrobacter sp. MF3-039]|uniref:NUDIX hydrolase n=1 Tax=Altererythrobacter sp. MF3-039 TaxID=3252901 RepID=UPI00390C833F